MTVPIPVLLERPSVSSAGRDNRVKKTEIDPGKSKFAQNLARAVKKQTPPEVSKEVKRGKANSMVESGEQPTTAPEKECQAKEAGSAGDLRSQKPEQNEGTPVNENELKALMNQPVILESAFADTAAQSQIITAEGSKTPQVLDQPAAGSKPEGIALIAQEASDQPDILADQLIQADKGKSKPTESSRENGGALPVKSTTANDSGFELNPKHVGVVDTSPNTAPQQTGEALITEMAHDHVVKKTVPQGREPERDAKSSIVSNPVGAKTDTKMPADVKKIITMESHVSSGKVTMVKANAENMDENGSNTEQGQEAPKFNLLLNQTDNLQVRETSSKVLDFPVKEQVDAKDLIQQIVKKAEVLLKSDVSEMKMQLKPEFLGKMLIKVTVEEGTVVTKIITENQHVKQVLEANLNSLRQNLEANGIKVEKTEVSVQLFNDGGGSYNESDSNRYPLWSEQQGQSRRSYPDNSYGLPETENLPGLPEETVKYGIGSEGQVNYLI